MQPLTAAGNVDIVRMLMYRPHHNEELLLALVRGRQEEAAWWARSAPPEPGRFVALCEECDVHAWVHACLERHGLQDWVGAETVERLRRLRHRVRKDNLLLLARAERALDVLLAAGVTPVALKGLDVLHRANGVEFDQRTLDDVDLLIARDELVPAVEALEGAGWTAPPEQEKLHDIRGSHHLRMTSPGPLTVDFELHWNLFQLLERAVPLSVAGREILRLDDHDLVAHLLVHHLAHYFDRRLKWLIDLRVVTRSPGFCWERVVERIREWGATAAAAAAIVHLRKLDPDAIPVEVEHALPLTPLRRLFTLPLRSGHPLDLFRNTQSRSVRLFLASALIENPLSLPAWALHRATRDQRPSANPLDPSH
jgi:hypothetical protein